MTSIPSRLVFKPTSLADMHAEMTFQNIMEESSLTPSPLKVSDKSLTFILILFFGEELENLLLSLQAGVLNTMIS